MEPLETWEGTLSTGDLDGLLAQVPGAILIGQRAGDFTLGNLDGGAAAWPSGRCFNPALEIRWWPGEDEAHRGVVILNQLPVGWPLPVTMKHEPHALAEAPDEGQRFLCVGRYDEHAPAGVHRWWESRYGRSFAYLDHAPPEGCAWVHLQTVGYALADGRVQHRLVGFEPVVPEEARP